jgi:hypothetical protein
MLGAPQAAIHTAADAALLLAVHAEINAKLGHNHTSYEIIAVSKQVVAGTNTFFHLVGKPGNDQYTITVHEPLGGGAPTVLEVSHGHHAHLQGHSAHSIPHGHHH